MYGRADQTEILLTTFQRRRLNVRRNVSDAHANGVGT